MAQDLTELRRAEQAVYAAKARFEGILQLAQDAIIAIDSHQRIILFNQGAEKIFGYSQAEIIGRPLDLLLPERLNNVHRKHIEEFARVQNVARRMGEQREVSGCRKDGSEFPAEASISMLDLGGDVVLTVILRDITERKRAEQRLLAQHTVARILAEAASIEDITARILQAVCECQDWDLGTLWRIDREAGVLRYAALFRRPWVEASQFEAATQASTFSLGSGLPGRVWASRTPAWIPDVVQDPDSLPASIAARDGIHAALAFPILLGSEVLGVIDFVSREIRQPDQALLDTMASIGSQIGQFLEHKRAEEELRLSQAYLAEAQRLTRTGSWAYNSATRTFLYWSQEMFRIYGLDPQGSHAPNLEEIDRFTHPEDRDRVDAQFQTAVREKTEFSAGFRIMMPDGTLKHLEVVGHPVIDKRGDGIEYIGTAVDVTERERAAAEKERLEARLQKAQTLEAIGTLAGGIAHDFNNILGAILGYGEMAQKEAPQGSALRRYVDNVMHAGARARALVERILAFSRTGIGERAPLNVRAIVEETLELLAASLPPTVRLERRLEAGEIAAIGSATELHQVVMNLCTNAVQAMPEGGLLDVRLEPAHVLEPRSLSHGGLLAGSYVCLIVRDTGTGIKPEVLDRIFDPFFTTKDVGQGTGLGLSLVHGIVTGVGGAIDVVSSSECGATFTIWLPALASVPPPALEADDRPPRGKGQVVMVVDDEPTLVALTEEMLAELGYEPVGFLSGTAALQAFSADPQRFDLVITDEMMPELAGTGLAQQIRRQRSDIPIAIMTGYSNSGIVALARSVGVSEMLRKPLLMRDIAESLARLLNVSSPRPSP